MSSKPSPSLRRSLLPITVLLLCSLRLAAQEEPRDAAALRFHVGPDEPLAVEVRVNGEPATLLHSPDQGLWSVGFDFASGWPGRWEHAKPSAVRVVGEWTLVEGRLELPTGTLELRDAYRDEGDRIRGLRRFTWRGKEPLEPCVLSVRFVVPGSLAAKPLLPGISYAGNPSGGRHPDCVPLQVASPGTVSLYEEHRFPMPFAALEWRRGDAFVGAALHTLPSRVEGGRHSDQWWSLGLSTTADATELIAFSGPCATNGRRNVVKALQGGLMDYPAAWVVLQPGAVVEKTFFVQGWQASHEGDGLHVPVRTALGIHRPFALADLPRAADILRAKADFAWTRFRDGERPGFEMYPASVRGTHYVMGWCGQAAAPGYSFLVLADRLGQAEVRARVARTLDLLATAPVDVDGFPVRYDAEAGTWSAPDPVSQGQAMETFALATEVGRARRDVDTAPWESFLRRACDAHAARILRDDWRPVSTNEAFLVSPLLRAARLFGEDRYRAAALHAVEHYAARHRDLREPYWGGTLDASCEDKEGAWAALQAFLAAYKDSHEPRHLDLAQHALDVVLSYVVVWDIDMPPGRLRDHAFRSRGWTAVSVQNQHLDVYGVVMTPAIWRMGELLGRPELQRLAAVMYRSCGQLIDPFGSQGEQIQQTNYAQHGDMSDVFRLRGGYSEGWTVFWITAHFLHAAASFERMGVDLDAIDGPQARIDSRIAPAPLYRDPVFDGAADPVLVHDHAHDAWRMLYTQRRAKLDLPGVQWCHGTEIGVAESRDGGRTWTYVGTLPLSAPDAGHSFWAPDVVEQDGVFHLFVSYVPGMHSDWSGERHVLHYSSRDLVTWQAHGRVPLTSDRCIDPSLFRFPDGSWRMWFKDEGHDSRTLAVESRDLEHWTPVDDPGVSSRYGEAPKVFRFGGFAWMLKDPDSGLDVYRSDDLQSWTYQGKILAEPGHRNDDGEIGKHADVVVRGTRAFIFYFTHPDGQRNGVKEGVMPFSDRRSSIQVAELEVRDGRLCCDRDSPCTVDLASSR
ncbi:MAG: exo-alpha-sialidase [Planctomycetota bacterium]